MAITHTVTFDDPAELAESVRTLGGLEFIERMMARGMRIPIGTTLGFQLVEATAGHAVFEAIAGPASLNPMGGVQGGWYACVLDAALGVCLHTLLPAGEYYTTIELQVRLVKAVRPDTGTLRATGRVVHRGRSTAITEARMEDANGVLYAHATATQLLMKA